MLIKKRWNKNVKFERFCVKNKKNGQGFACPFVNSWLLIYYIYSIAVAINLRCYPSRYP